MRAVPHGGTRGGGCQDRVPMMGSEDRVIMGLENKPPPSSPTQRARRGEGYGSAKGGGQRVVSGG
jgi:hypothetical protein